MLGTKDIGSLLVIVLVSACSSFALTQTKPPFYTLEVRVLETFHPKKIPLYGIRIELTNKKKEVICSGTTDSLGAVFFDNHCLQNYLDTLIFKFYRGEEYLVWDDYEFINIGSGEEVSIKELAQLIKDITDFDGEIIWDDSYPDGTPRKLLDSSKILNLGWKPKISLVDGLATTYDWYLDKVKLA
jgi:dTDP-D-glucose 4,6-dehydratase